MKLIFLLGIVISVTGAGYFDNPDYRPAFLHRSREGSFAKYRVGVQLPQEESLEWVDDQSGIDEETAPNRQRRALSEEEVNDGPGGTFEIKESVDGQEGEDTLVELGESRYGDSDGQDAAGRNRRSYDSDSDSEERSDRRRRSDYTDPDERKDMFDEYRRAYAIEAELEELEKKNDKKMGRFRRMLLPPKESDEDSLLRRGENMIRHGRRCRVDKDGRRKCSLHRPQKEDGRQVGRPRRALEGDLVEKPAKDVKPWLRAKKNRAQLKRKNEVDEEQKGEFPRRRNDWRQRSFRRRCIVGGLGRRRCLPRPDRELERPGRQTREIYPEEKSIETSNPDNDDQTEVMRIVLEP